MKSRVPLVKTRPPLGRVILVGAGPGDPELLTIKAVKAIQSADVLLVDDLVHDAVLAYAPPMARVVYVGKRGGCKSTPQAFIEKLMVAEARAGHVVVRLKGGDPFVFGRGGEERATLREAGIACEVVNGITAGLAAPSALGIPLTHRDYCHGAIFITGHAGEPTARMDASCASASAPAPAPAFATASAAPAASEPDWPALVATQLPLVIYMGVSRVATLVDALLAAGMSPDMPVAVVQNATRQEQVSLVTTLNALAHDIVAARIASPAILIVGRTVALADALTADLANAQRVNRLAR
jgi:uroporphyrin-III C-methyltransferase